MWLDWDHDGLQGDGELGLPGLAVRLFTSGGALAAETTTDENGGDWFPTVPPGTYYLQFGRSIGSAVTAATVRLDLDAGLTPPGALGGTVWYDADHDGIRDPNEPVAGSEVTVELLDAVGVVLQTTTLVQGAYAFNQLPPGSYRIRFVIPADSAFTIPNQGTDETLDSDVLPGGTTDLTWNAGLVLGSPDPDPPGGVE